MNKYEILKINERLLNIIESNNINIRDVHHIPMYEEYKKMKAKKHKISYIVCYLGCKYSLTERGIYKILKRFDERVKM